MFTLLDSEKYFFLNRSRTTQEGSQGLWDYPQPTPEASRYPKQHQKSHFFFVESGTSNQYYQVKASSIFVFPRTKNKKNVSGKVEKRYRAVAIETPLPALAPPNSVALVPLPSRSTSKCCRSGTRLSAAALAD